MPTAYEALLYVFNYFDFGDDVGAYPFEMRLVNWEAASKIKVKKKWVRGEQALDLLFQVGFSKERVTKIVDPALIPVISRLLDLKILTFFSCSGHPKDMTPYLTMAFPSEAFGRAFLATCAEAFPKNELELSGHQVAVIQYQVGSVELPIEVCLQKRLPISFHWHPENVRACAEVWRKFSLVIDRFDDQGEYTPTQESLRQKMSYGAYEQTMLIEVLKSLFAHGAKYTCR